MFQHLLISLYTIINLQFIIINCDYIVPEPTIEILENKGFRASIPDTPGIVLFAFHGRINKAFVGNEAGEFAGEATAAQSNQWTYENNKATFQNGDVLYYWIYVQHENLGYRLDEQKYEILVNGSRPVRPPKPPLIKPPSGECDPSITIVDGNRQCKGALIFNEDFNDWNPLKWEHAIELPSDEEDNEFVSYQNQPEVCGVKDGHFVITPKLLATLPGFNAESIQSDKLDFRGNCTAIINPDRECYRQAGREILPSVVSCKIRTKEKFSFKYGQIEIRAKFPIGDWMFPQLFLDNDPIFGYGYSNGQLRVGFIHSNEYLINNTVDISGRRLYGGAVLAQGEQYRKDLYSKFDGQEHFGKDFHVYTLIWSDNKITLKVDGTIYGDWDNDYIKYAQNQPFRKIWANAGSVTPFMKEYYITLGVGVGGVSDFPDTCKTGSPTKLKNKPWQNRDPRMLIGFWRDTDNWYNTWLADQAVMKIDYVKVYAI